MSVQDSGSQNDATIYLRLPGRLRDELRRQWLRYSLDAPRRVSESEFVRMVLAAHVNQTPCPCSTHCSGG